MERIESKDRGFSAEQQEALTRHERWVEEKTSDAQVGEWVAKLAATMMGGVVGAYSGGYEGAALGVAVGRSALLGYEGLKWFAKGLPEVAEIFGEVIKENVARFKHGSETQ